MATDDPCALLGQRMTSVWGCTSTHAATAAASRARLAALQNRGGGSLFAQSEE